jgi:hypothetical protein
VGRAAEFDLRVQVIDRFENPVPQTGVAFEVVQGGGRIDRPTISTDVDGVASPGTWTLGSRAGLQRLQATVLGPQGPGGLLRRSLDVAALPGPPARLRLTDGLPTGVVGLPLGPAFSDVQIALVDAFGNGNPGVRLSFSLLPGSGEIGVQDAVTGPLGTVPLPPWTLGTVSGNQTLLVRPDPAAAPGVDAFLVVVRAAAGPPASYEAVSPTALTGPVSTVAQPSPAVRVRDQYGNATGGVPVRFEIRAGGGIVTPALAPTGSDGIAQVGTWIFGPAAGTHVLEARLEVPGSVEVSTLRFTAEVQGGEGPGPDDPSRPIRVVATHLNQGSQTLLGETPLVTGRPGLLRVFLQADTPTAPGARVRLLVRSGGGQVVSDRWLTRDGGGGIEALAPDPGRRNRSWNQAIPGAWVQPGFSWRLEVEVEPGTPLVSWPASGEWFTPRVVGLPPFRATFIPVHIQSWNLTGRITPSNLADYARVTLDAFPLGETDLQVRTTPLVYDGPVSNSSLMWNTILQDIRDLRLLEGAIDRYYHGILRRAPGPGTAGIAYIAANPEGVENLAAVSFDELPNASAIIAHEFGHNFGRLHAPCAVTAQLDPNFPHAGATLGSPGYAPSNDQLLGDPDLRDLMSYCFPNWSSDYTYAAILGMREARPVGSPPLAVALTGSVDALRPEVAAGLLIGGGWDGETGFLRPSLAVDAPLTRQDPRGDVQIQVEDATGRILFVGRYASAALDHPEGGMEVRHFGALLPFPNGWRGPRLVRVRTPRGEWTEVVREGAGGDRTPPRWEGDPSGRIRLRWDPADWPVVLLRDSTTNELLGFLRSGEVLLPAELSGRPLAVDAHSGTARALRFERPPGR